MKIKGMEGHEHNVTSQGQGNFNSVGAGAGIASFLGLNAGNILGGGWGGNGGQRGGCGDPYESKEAAYLREQIATLRAENFSRASSTEAFEKSAEYTTRLHDAQAVNIKELLNQSIVQGVAIQRVDDKINTETALIKGEIATQVALLRGEMNTTAALAAKDREALAKDIKIEAERRCCADNAIVSYVNQTFYVKQVADVDTSSTTTSQPTYNPIPNCNPCCGL